LKHSEEEAHLMILRSIKDLKEESKVYLIDIKQQTEKTNGRVTRLESLRIQEEATAKERERNEARNEDSRKDILYKVLFPILTSVATAIITYIIFHLASL